MVVGHEHEMRCREVERYLFRICSNAEKESKESADHFPSMNFQLEIYEAGIWLIKFRAPYNVLVNNSEMVLMEGVNLDASLAFSTLGNFWATINGNMTLEASTVKSTGSKEALSLFHRKIFSSSVIKAQEGVSTKTLAKAKTRKDPSSQLLKSGWLLKRKDVLRGWNSRYFKVYVGRFEYYMDPSDDIPRAVIPMWEATHTYPEQVKVKGYVHHQIFIEPKLIDKTFRLASERKGIEGRDDMLEWGFAFEVSTKTPEEATKLLRQKVDSGGMVTLREGDNFDYDVEDDDSDIDDEGDTLSALKNSEDLLGRAQGTAISPGGLSAASPTRRKTLAWYVRKASKAMSDYLFALIGMQEDGSTNADQAPFMHQVTGSLIAIVLLILGAYRMEVDVTNRSIGSSLLWVFAIIIAIGLGILAVQVMHRFRHVAAPKSPRRAPTRRRSANMNKGSSTPPRGPNAANIRTPPSGTSTISSGPTPSPYRTGAPLRRKSSVKKGGGSFT